MRTPREPLARGLAAAAATGPCFLYCVSGTFGLLLRCSGDTDYCEVSNSDLLAAAGLFVFSSLVVVFVVGWRVWRQPHGMLRAVIEAVLGLVLIVVLLNVVDAVIPVTRTD